MLLKIMLSLSPPSQAADATSQIASFMNGVAGLGPIAEGLVIGYVGDHYGWDIVFYAITALCVLAGYIMHRASRYFRDFHNPSSV